MGGGVGTEKIQIKRLIGRKVFHKGELRTRPEGLVVEQGRGYSVTPLQ